MGPHATTGRDHMVGLGLAAGYVALLLLTAGDLAMSRDESFYAVAAERYGAWFTDASQDFDVASEQANIDRHWSYNHEHPALFKSAFALTLLAQESWEIFPDTSTAIRFPGMISAGLLLWLLYIFGQQVGGRFAGGFASLSFALIPRIFYHSHLACFDIPITLTVTWVVYCYWRSLVDKRWLIMAGIAFGLSLATKHNTWIVPGILLIHWGWAVWGEIVARRAGELHGLRLVPWWLLPFAILGPLIFVGTWPWLWSDTAARIEEYVRFHVHHEYYNMAYFGRNYFLPPFPVSFPWVMTLYTVPFTMFALSIYGMARRWRTLLPPVLEYRLLPIEKRQADRMRTDVLLVGAMLAPLVVISLPSTPIFGGTKHWFPSYPFLAIYAGIGASMVNDRLQTLLARTNRARGLPPTAIVAAAASLLLAPSIAETAHNHPFGLSHYGVIEGGLPGAADDGMNRQFWGYTQGSLANWFREEMPNGGSVWICDATHQSWQMMQKDGRIPTSIRAASNMATADLVLVHHEHHFAEVDFQAWVAFGSVQPVHVLTHDGVPIISVYENPRRRD